MQNAGKGGSASIDAAETWRKAEKDSNLRHGKHRVRCPRDRRWLEGREEIDPRTTRSDQSIAVSGPPKRICGRGDVLEVRKGSQGLGRETIEDTVVQGQVKRALDWVDTRPERLNENPESGLLHIPQR